MGKHTVIIGLGVAVVAVVAVVLLLSPHKATAPTQEQKGEPTSFEECVAQGNAVMESYPRQCRSASGKLFVENIGNELDKSDLIRINEPRPGQRVSAPLSVNGEARGTWFFEASFPIELQDAEGNTIGEGHAEVQGDWMTEDFVPFLSTPITFSPQPAGSKGLLILKKDNPSGLPENDDALEVPVVF